MSFGESILSQFIVNIVITKVIEEVLLRSGCFRIGVNVAQRIQRPAKITSFKPAAVIFLLPEVTGAVQHPIKAYCRVPVELVHDFG